MLLPSGNPIICHKSLCPYNLSSLLINNVLTFSPHDWVDAQKVYREMRTHYCMLFIFILSSIVSSFCNLFASVLVKYVHGDRCRSVQNNGGSLPDITLLTLCYYHRGTRLYAIRVSVPTA